MSYSADHPRLAMVLNNITLTPGFVFKEVNEPDFKTMEVP